MKLLSKIILLVFILFAIIFAIKLNLLNQVSFLFSNNSHNSQLLQSPYLGIRYKIVSPEIARINHKPQGAYVVKVEDNSPAQTGGILPGDIIISINDQPITNTDLGQTISNQPPHTTLSIFIDRDGQKITTTVTL